MQNPLIPNAINYKECIDETAEELYEHAPCGYLSYLPDGTIVKINQTLLDWTGFNRQEVLYVKKFQQLLSIGGKIFYETHYSPLLQMQGIVKEINYDILRKDCSLFPALINSIQIKDKSGNPLLFRTTVFDISDRKKYEIELLKAKKKAQEATKAKAQFLSTISHEIRTPMNAVLGMTSLLMEKSEGDQQQMELLKILNSSGQYLLNLVNDILDFSKIESGKILLDEKVFHIRELLYSIIYSLGIKAEEKGITLKYFIDEKLPSLLLGDPVKLTQILTNLIGNAIKFTHQGSVTIELKTKEINDYIVNIDFSVTDTGIGIAKEKQEQIFEEFSQGGYEINQQYGGTGLGLAISSKLLSIFGSDLKVNSIPGKGSVFYFNLSLKVDARKQNHTLVEEEFHATPDALKGIKILVAEDNEVNVLVLKQFLNKWGVEYERVENGEQAIENVKAFTYDLILMDLQMPKVDGYQASRYIRNLPGENYKRIPIIALSAFSKHDIEASLQQAQINDFVSKPFNPKELFAKIASHTINKIKNVSPSSQAALSKSLPKPSSSAYISINLNKFRELSLNKENDFNHLLTLSIRDLTEFKSDSIDALQRRDTQLIEKLFHKNKTTLILLEATKLQALIQKAILLLQEQASDHSLRTVSETISAETDCVIDELHSAMKKK